MPPKKGTPAYDAWIKKLSDAKKGKPSHWRGKKRDEATNKKISDTLKQREIPPEQRVAQQEGYRRYIENLTPEQRKEIGAKHLGRKQSPGHVAKRVAAHKGRPSPLKGRHIPEDIKQVRYANVRGQTWSKGRKMPEHVKQMLFSPEITAKRAASYSANFAALPLEEQQKRIEAWVQAGQRSGIQHDTSIERFVATQLDAFHITYETQKHIGRYTVDFFLPEQNLILEVNGCYWHSCEECDLINPFKDARERDRKRLASLEAKGYMVAVLWEHDLRPFMGET